ncbi:hypothetical protein FACS1894152_1620 [Bacilli bacterium]|nr:hypothetical protein FACS1894152_1620 [Bacilli bacterium]
MEVGELFIKLGMKLFNVDSVDKLQKALDNTKAKAEKVGGAMERQADRTGGLLSGFNKLRIGIVATTAVMVKFASDTINSAMNLDRLAGKLDMSLQNLQRWQIAGTRAQADVNSVFESIKKTRDDFKNGKSSNISAWQFLGIDMVGGDPDEAMKQLVDKLKGVQKSERSAILDRLGLDSNNINLGDIDLNIGKMEGIVKSDKEMENVKELNRAYIDLKLSLTLLRDRFIAFATPIKYFFELITRLTTGIDSLVKKTIGWEKAGKIVSGVILGLLAIVSPITVGIAALALVVEDLITYFNGGESVIGKLIDRFPLLGKVVNALGGIFKTLWNILKDLWSTVVILWDRFLDSKAFDTMKEAVGTLADIFVSLLASLKSLWDIVVLLWDKFKDTKVFETLKQAFLDTINAIVEGFALLFGWWKKLQDAIGGGLNWVKDRLTGKNRDRDNKEEETEEAEKKSFFGSIFSRKKKNSDGREAGEEENKPLFGGLFRGEKGGQSLDNLLNNNKGIDLQPITPINPLPEQNTVNNSNDNSNRSINRTNNNNLNNYITINSDQPPREIARQVGEVSQDVLNRVGVQYE